MLVANFARRNLIVEARLLQSVRAIYNVSVLASGVYLGRKICNIVAGHTPRHAAANIAVTAGPYLAMLIT